MQVLLLNKTDSWGGAARAAYRLHEGLRNIQVNSQILVQEKAGNDPHVLLYPSWLNRRFPKLRARLNRLPVKFYPPLGTPIFSPQWVPDHLPQEVAKLNPDIISLQWICEGYLQIESLPKFTKPLVWTLHDMWVATGGCHHSESCENYVTKCGNCPVLQSNQEQDLSRWVWERKQKSWQNLNLTLVSPSNWLAEKVALSPLFSPYRIEVIPNGLNLDIYQPIDKKNARKQLNLPQDKKLILFGAMQGTADRWKGFYHLESALKELIKSDLRPELELVIFGSDAPENPPDFGFNCHYLGKINQDEKLALVYSAVDVFVAPSVVDNLPNTVMESLACGTPSVAFHIGGLPDLIEPEENGYLARPFEPEDLAQGIIWVIENPERHQKLCENARQKAERAYNIQTIAHRYLSLFEEILSQQKS